MTQNEEKERCTYDTSNMGECYHCVRRGGCKTLGGPFAEGDLPAGTRPEDVVNFRKVSDD